MKYILKGDFAGYNLQTKRILYNIHIFDSKRKVRATKKLALYEALKLDYKRVTETEAKDLHLFTFTEI